MDNREEMVRFIKKYRISGLKSFKKQINIVLLLVAVTILIVIESCKSPTSPKIDNTPPGRRDYTWTVDTIKIGSFTNLSRIGGSSPNDLWVVGCGGNAEECLWHYDGQKWTSPNIYVSSSFYGIFGLKGNEVWAGDVSNRIYKYDGNWSIFKTLPLNGYKYMVTSNIWGDSPSNIYTASALERGDSANDYTGIIAHYDGKDWSLLNTPYINVGFNDIRVQKSTGIFIIQGLNNNNGLYLEKILVYDNKVFKELFSTTHLSQLGYINGEVYMIVDQKIYKYLNNTLTLWKDFSNTLYYSGFKGRSEKDIIGFGIGKLIHYNGENWATLLESENLQFSDSIIFDDDYFVIAENMTTREYYIIRGTLK
jgi:hypothetical protein